MTLEQLLSQRDEISMLMIEAEGEELRELEQELIWIEELIAEAEVSNDEEF